MIFRNLFYSLIAVLLIAEIAAAEPALVYILDGSGSMWGRVDGKPKITAAKEVMSELVTGMPDGLRTGLIVYGHRRKGDCSDIEELIPLGSLKRTAALETIRNISPKGKTPISDSIRKAADSLKGTEDEATIVLVSDGIETCQQDPCAVARSLKESGARFVLHVVGFGIKESDKEQLACIAESGGGRFFRSSSAQELLSALSDVQQSVVENRPVATLPEPEKEPQPAVVKQEVSGKSSSINIKAKGPGRIAFKHHDWLKAPYYWKLLDPETGEEKGRFSGLGEQLVAPGDYQLLWRQVEHGSQEVTLGEVFPVESGTVTEVPLLTSVRFTLPDWLKKPYYWSLKDPTTGENVARYSLLEPVLVPPGSYELIWRQVEHGAQEVDFGGVTIESDIENRIDLTAAVVMARADWVPKKVHYWGLKPIDSDEWVAKFGHFQPHIVPPGQYRLIYDMDEHGSSDSDLGIVTIEANKLNELPMNTGVRLIPQPGMEAPYRIEFIELDDAGNEVRTVRMSRRFEPMALKPGRYRLTYHQSEHGSSKMTIVDSFDLPAGNLVQIEL
jgi:Ca-activated chloride channel homolog